MNTQDRDDSSRPACSPPRSRLKRLDLDRPIQDGLVLRTVPGAVDYLYDELRTFVGADLDVVERFRDAIHVSYRGPLRPIAAMRYYDTCGIALFPDPAVRIRESQDRGVLSAMTAESPEIAFRVGDLGDTRWEIRDQFESNANWRNSPNNWDLNIDNASGGLVAEVGELYLTERFGQLLRAPASTNPVIAAVMVRLAKIENGQTVLDPFCGAGTLLVLAGEMAKPGRLIGSELQPSWARTSKANLATRNLSGSIINADARHLPFPNFAIDRVVANMPFGKRVGSHQINTEMYPLTLREISRVMTRQGRAVLLTEDKRLFRETVQRTPLLRIIKEIVIERGGAHPSAYVVVKRGNNKVFER